MALAPNGDLVVVNGHKTVVPNGAGDLFGPATTSRGLLLVNDGTDALDLYHG